MHLVGTFTQLPIERCHLTKHELPPLLAACDTNSVCSVKDVLTNSGDMDWHGTKMCLERIARRHPNFLVGCQLTRDGDVKGHPIATLAPTWLVAEAGLLDAGCYTHALKNLFKFADKTLPKEDCRCARKTVKNHRFTSPLPTKMHAWVYNLMYKAEMYYLPEKAENYCAEGDYPLVAGDVQRAERRTAAIEYFCLEIDVMLQHFQNEHTLCTHEPLAPDASFFACSAQVERLASYLNDLKANAPLLLSPIGITHVQYVESNHGIIARRRHKGINMSAAACWLGEVLALLEVLELQLAANGTYRLAVVELFALVHEHLNFYVQIDADLLMKGLLKRCRHKSKRSSSRYKAKVAERRAKKRAANAKNKKGTSGAYASGGPAAAVAADVTVAS